MSSLIAVTREREISMKKLFCVFALILAFVSQSVQAAPSAGTAVRVAFASSSIGTASWVPVVTSTQKGVKGISIFSSASTPIEVGIAFANSAADSEVRQMIVPPALTGVGAPGAIFYPMSLGYGTRVSIRAVTATISSGEIDMSLFYN